MRGENYMSKLLDIIANETDGKSFKTYKYGFEGIEVPRFDYDDHRHHITWEKIGETAPENKPKNLTEQAKMALQSPPLFAYFLDGSRKTYKVDDMAYRNQVYPIIAGQVGVGCCTRVNMDMQPLYYENTPMFERHLVVSLPKIAKANDWDDDELAFEHLRKKINARKDLTDKNIEFAKILSYATNVEIGDKIENKGIASIQDYMIEREKYMVAELVKKGFLLPDKYLIKDGSLEYQVHGITNKNELARFRNNYQFVVGVSKSFNPENCVDKNKRNNSNLIAQLPLYHRTPVNMYSSDRIGDMHFAVWFVRIRNSKYTLNAFDGILKIEKILVTDEQIQNGLESEEVDMITANIINERAPVCYGADRRWANHLYPVYITESFIKSKYLGENMFLNLF